MLALVIGVAYLGWSLLLWVEWWSLVGEFCMPPLRPDYSGPHPWQPECGRDRPVAARLGGEAGLGLRPRLAGRLSIGGLWLLLAGRGPRVRQPFRLAGAGRHAAMVGLLWCVTPAGRAVAPVRCPDAGADWRRGPGWRAARSGCHRCRPLILAPASWMAATVGVPSTSPPRSACSRRPRCWGWGPGPGLSLAHAIHEAGELDFYIPHAHDQVPADAGRVRPAGALCCHRGGRSWRGSSGGPSP